MSFALFFYCHYYYYYWVHFVFLRTRYDQLIYFCIWYHFITININKKMARHKKYSYCDIIYFSFFIISFSMLAINFPPYSHFFYYNPANDPLLWLSSIWLHCIPLIDWIQVSNTETSFNLFFFLLPTCMLYKTHISIKQKSIDFFSVDFSTLV